MTRNTNYLTLPVDVINFLYEREMNADGKVYLGYPDTDPVVEANRITVYQENEQGDIISVAQPLIINNGNRSKKEKEAVKLFIEQDCSVSVYDKSGKQVIYLSRCIGVPVYNQIEEIFSQRSKRNQQLTETIEQALIAAFITPEMPPFNGNIQAAADAAAEQNLPLMTGRKDYNLQYGLLLPTGLTWISSGTRLRMIRAGSGGSDPRDSVLIPSDNCKIIGKVYLYMIDSPGAAAFRAHCLIGNWTTGIGVNNFTFDEFILEGGHTNVNSVAIAGSSCGIRGNRIDAGKSKVIGRVLMTHWGNFSEHYLRQGIYQHSPDAGPTTHPHDIHIKEVLGDLTANISDFMALVCISAGYDTSVERITGSVNNESKSASAQLLLLIAGDMGFAYATAEQRAAGMKNLVFNTINGSTNKMGISRIGRALYYNSDSTPQLPENYYVKTNETVINFNAKSTSKSTIYSAIGGSNWGGCCNYGTVITDGFVNSFSPGNNDTGGIISQLISRNNQYNALLYAGAGNDKSNYPRGLCINRLVIDGTGAQEYNELYCHGVRTRSCNDLIIGSVEVLSMHEKGYAVTFGQQTSGIHIGSIRLPSSYRQQAASLNSVNGVTDNQVSHVSDSSIYPISGGITVKSFGLLREFLYEGGELPPGINVLAGDRFVAAKGKPGQPALSIITTAGVIGADAVAKVIYSF
ncbi:hypothetical protein C7M52_01354 [Mixta theicola]|nr:phage tailspike protein [Mixta theicola]QHM75400.1 hypothetical protein C7M52_01354 [Mixta theicola]